MLRVCCLMVLSLFTASPGIASSLEISMRDGYRLTADIVTPENSTASVLLLHQCNRDRRMWAPVTHLLNDSGFSTMTVDARGFGESKSDEFDISVSDEAYDKATEHFPTDAHDIYKAWIANSPKARVRAVVGASCGGAMASRLAGSYLDIEAIVLFSPALRPYWFAKELWAPLHARKSMPILGIVSIGDGNSLVGVERAVNASTAERTEFIRYNGRLHGEPLFELDPNLPRKMATWITGVLR